jgi:hypothetical protein
MDRLLHVATSDSERGSVWPESPNVSARRELEGHIIAAFNPFVALDHDPGGWKKTAS